MSGVLYPDRKCSKKFYCNIQTFVKRTIPGIAIKLVKPAYSEFRRFDFGKFN